MNTKRILYSGFILGGVLGWMLGFLRFPYVEMHRSFLPGLICGFAVMIFIWLVVSNREKKQEQQKKYVFVNKALTLFAFFIVICCVVVSILLFKQSMSLRNQLAVQEKKIKDLSEQALSAASGNLAGLMQRILDDVANELEANPGAVLSDTLVNKIAAVSHTFKPYKYFTGDSLTERIASPERGQLLLALLLMDMDSASFEKVKRNVTFSYADLHGAYLRGANLSNADLKGANFQSADLSKALFLGADLSDANLYAAKLDSALLDMAILKRADMRWARLNYATLKMANMNGAQMMHSQFIHAVLFNANMQWADMSGAIFREAGMYKSNLMGSIVNNTNFTKANLDRSNLRLIQADASIFNGVQLHAAIADSSWFNNMEVWRLIGKDEIKNTYILVNDTTIHFNYPLFRFQKIDQ
jgi:uncharacterized protein YjbI with pentapeptide repeats